MKRTEIKRTPFRKQSRAETEARAKKRAARADVRKSTERAARRIRKAINRKTIDLVMARDFGRCQICLCDTLALYEWLEGLPRWAGLVFMRATYAADDEHTRALPGGRLLGRHRARAIVLLGRLWGVVLGKSEHLFEIDHITPVAEGGSDDPSNLRTLCRRCHRIESAALNNRLRSRPTKGVGRGF